LQPASLAKSFTWGIDLSGTLQGAGGVGGLLAVTDSTGTYYPTYDGNGNISEYLNSTGAIAAHYEYDPFGKTTVATGPKANDFAHRFSTKPLDLTTGLYYYGYRFYDPNSGRWPSRDPIEENGGINLYGFVGNDGVNKWDVLGMAPEKCCIEKIIVHFDRLYKNPYYDPNKPVQRPGYPVEHPNRPAYKPGSGGSNRPAGRTFLGSMTFICRDGTMWFGSAQSGGMKFKNSPIQGDNDSSTPAGTFDIYTSRTGGTQGYAIGDRQGNIAARSLIKLHYASYVGSHGCVTTRSKAEIDDINTMMDYTRTVGKLDKTKIVIQYGPGLNPKGTLGNGNSDSPDIPPHAIPVNPEEL
jgi:RHS repeat-associated protein